MRTEKWERSGVNDAARGYQINNFKNNFQPANHRGACVLREWAWTQSYDTCDLCVSTFFTSKRVIWHPHPHRVHAMKEPFIFN